MCFLYSSFRWAFGEKYVRALLVDLLLTYMHTYILTYLTYLLRTYVLTLLSPRRRLIPIDRSSTSTELIWARGRYEADTYIWTVHIECESTDWTEARLSSEELD